MDGLAVRLRDGDASLPERVDELGSGLGGVFDEAGEYLLLGDPFAGLQPDFCL